MVLHMESNVTTAVALLNPEAKMVHVASVLGRAAPVSFTEVDRRRLLRAMVGMERKGKGDGERGAPAPAAAGEMARPG
jgi:hypothetical protein